MSHSSAYGQLLTLIGARSQQWLRTRVDLLPMTPGSDDDHFGDLAEIAVAAHICTGFRGTAAPLESFIHSRFTPQFVSSFLAWMQENPASDERRGSALIWLLCQGNREQIQFPQALSLHDRLACSRSFDESLLAEAGTMLSAPVPEERITEQVIDRHARLLSLCYRFGAERPRFAHARVYGDVFANCLRFADWAQRKGRLTSLAQMCYCLCLIDPDHDVSEMLADIMSSQRPDGSFPARIGFGTADQGDEALAPTLAALIALHMAVHRRWRSPQPTLPIAA